MNELVSIIVPVFNVAPWIKRCFLSLKNQTYPNIEVLFINDGSSDESAEIIKNLIRDDHRFTLFNKENGGPGSARNFGLKNAKGEYCIFVDSDDDIRLDAVENLLQVARDERLDVLAANSFVTELSGRQRPGIKIVKPVEGVVTGMSFMAQSIKRNQYSGSVCINVYRVPFLREFGLYFDEATLIEDEEWMPRVFEKAERVKFIDFQFYHYHLRVSSQMSADNLLENYKAVLYVCNKLDEHFKKGHVTKEVKILLNHLVEMCLEWTSDNLQYLFIYKQNTFASKMIWNAMRISTFTKVLFFKVAPNLYARCKHKYRLISKKIRGENNEN